MPTKEKSWTNTVRINYQKMFNDEKLSDFELKTKDGEQFKAHKSILAARSPKFFSMLTNNITEAYATSYITSEFDSVVMKQILRFIYCHEVENLDEIALDLIHAAEKYQLDDLKEMCMDRIIANLSTNNVLKALTISNTVRNTKKLFDRCLEFIIR